MTTKKENNTLKNIWRRCNLGNIISLDKDKLIEEIPLDKDILIKKIRKIEENDIY